MAPGRLLHEDELSARLGVSKIPVREALARLEPDGLVAGLARRGCEIAAMSCGEADKIFGLHTAIEAKAEAPGGLTADGSDRTAAGQALAALERAVACPACSSACLNRDRLAVATRAGEHMSRTRMDLRRQLASA